MMDEKKAFELEEQDKFQNAEDVPKPIQRDTWRRKFDFIITSVASTVGFGNVWRFPYLCYKMGGGAFLIPYIIAIATVGFPIMFLEVAVSQFMRQGAIGMWNICPLFKGIGYLTVAFAYLDAAYYAIIFVWFVLYLGSSFQNPLPWSHCGNPWNTNSCSVQYSDIDINITNDIGTNMTDIPVSNTSRIDPAVEFWRNYVLELSSGLEEPGTIVWKLLICLILIYILLFVCIWKGIDWIAKIAYVTGIAPYLLLTVLLVMGATKEGALDGIMYYLKPDMNKLADFEVWYNAICQVMFSNAFALTIWPALGSFNKFNQNCYRHMIIIVILNAVSSFYSGFVIFTLLGHMAHLHNVPIDKVATSGPGLVFIVYPRALAELPVPQLWCFLFFFTMILVGIDSVIVFLEALIVAIMDISKYLTKHRKLVLLASCIVLFVGGLPMITQGGAYVFLLVDYYIFGGIMLVVIGLLEIIAIGWGYGADKLYDNVELMLGYRINIWLKLCWVFITPCILMATLLYQLISMKVLVYDQYEYPQWAVILMIVIVILLLTILPIYIIYKVQQDRSISIIQRLKYLRLPILKDYQVPEKWYDGSQKWVKR